MAIPSWDFRLTRPPEAITEATQVGLAHGTYTGDGSTGRAIPTGFAPKVVCVKADHATNGHAMMRTSTMSNAKNVTNSTEDAGISSLTATGFTVDHITSTNGRTNEVGKTYYWWALGGDLVAVGSFTGGSQTIANLVFSPVFVAVLSIGDANTRIRSTHMTTESYDLATSLGDTDGITALTSDGFTVGANGDFTGVNHYWALPSTSNVQVGTYQGTGADNRNLPVTPMSFNPDIVITKGNIGQEARVKTTSLVGDASLQFGSEASVTNRIQSLTPAAGQFQVGTDPDVNNSGGEDYYFLAIAAASVGVTAEEVDQRFDFVLALDSNGAPRIELGSSEEEGVQAGTWETVRIFDWSGGTGQFTHINETKYQSGDGWDGGEEFALRKRGGLTTQVNVATNIVTDSWNRHGVFFDAGDNTWTVTRAGAYRNASLASNGNFSGSFAHYAGRTYAGTLGMPSEAAKDITNNVATNWNAALLASNGEKMWRANWIANNIIEVSWTDDIAGAPNHSWHAAFQHPAARPRDLFILGGHAILGVAELETTHSKLVAVDQDGYWVPLVNEMRPITGSAPWMGGQVVLTAGEIRPIWMPDVNSFTALSLMPVAHDWGSASIPIFDQATSIPTGGAALATDQDTMYYSVYGTFNNQLGSGTTTGSAVFAVRLSGNKVESWPVITPEENVFLQSAYVVGMAVQRALWGSQLVVVVRADNAGTPANGDYKARRLNLWSGTVPPATFPSEQSYLRTSWLTGQHWHTKKLARVRGLYNDTAGAMRVKVFVDGGTSPISNTQVASDIPFSVSAPNNAIGRMFAIQVEHSQAEQMELHAPLELDYYAVPEELDYVRMTVELGDMTVDRMGALGLKSQATAVVDVESVVQTEAVWALEWGNGLPDWSVIPISYKAVAGDADTQGHSGTLLAEMLFKRVS